MARQNRRDVIDESSVGVYHCVSRCVRGLFLCGEDRNTGRNYDHRKGWLEERLAFLAGAFAIDVLGFCVMSNHFHALLRNRPDVAGKWKDSEVAWRWWNLYPKRRNQDGSPAEPNEKEIKELVRKARKLRRRLSSISWLMRCLKEPVARRANQEDETTGHFWQGRFKSQRILDETSLLACLIYIDLNPIRAAIAMTPESSRFTSAFLRIQARRQRAQQRKMLSGQFEVDGWLSPLQLEQRERQLECQPSQRASNTGCLPMTEDQYLELLDWTGRQLRTDKRGAIPANLSPILERLQVASSSWVELIAEFGRWFRRAVGRPPSMEAERERRGCRWLQGIAHARQAFV